MNPYREPSPPLIPDGAIIVMSTIDEYPRARTREENGQLDDPDALAVACAVSKFNCRAVMGVQANRVAHFVARIAELSLTAKDVVIVLINADDVHGSELADALMPGNDWRQVFRDQGQVPFARGLAKRDGIQDALALFDEQAAAKLRVHEGIAVVVLDYGVAEVFALEIQRCIRL